MSNASSFQSPHDTFFPFGLAFSPYEFLLVNIRKLKFKVKEVTDLEAMCSGDDNDWVAADDGGTTPVKGIVAKFDCALPRQLVLGGLITPNNSSCGLSTRYR